MQPEEFVTERAGQLRLRDEYRSKLGKQHRVRTLVDELFINPYTTVARTAAALGVTSPTASKAITAMERIGLLEEVTGREWGRFWLARPILNLVNEPYEARSEGADRGE